MGWPDRLWYGRVPWLLPFWPLEWLFRKLSQRRRKAYQCAATPIWKAPAPVIVVGNISVGGVGKTPLVIRLVEMLQQAGYRPGVISRGYGAKAPGYPFVVTAASSAEHSGDEPLMIARRCGCPVVIDPDRVQACRTLLADSAVDVVIADDGLQHYKLARDIEIAVVDGQRGLGNGHCLPVGPLREPEPRLDQVDFCVVNGGDWVRPGSVRMTLKTAPLRLLCGKVAQLEAGPVNAVAGIGNPARFFASLRTLGFEVIARPFADHHKFCVEDLMFNNSFPTIMTEKDAVKCRAFAADNRYYLPVDAQLPVSFEKQLLDRVSLLRV